MCIVRTRQNESQSGYIYPRRKKGEKILRDLDFPNDFPNAPFARPERDVASRYHSSAASLEKEPTQKIKAKCAVSMTFIYGQDRRHIRRHSEVFIVPSTRDVFTSATSQRCRDASARVAGAK